MLMLFFGLLSLPAGLEVKKSLVKVGEAKPIVEHIRGTLISGIAAYTAFFVGVTIIQIMKRKYNKKV